MGSPLGPVRARILMKELDKSLSTTLMEYVTHWKQYVDNTIAVIKLASTESVLPTFNNFYQNIKFTYELEQKRKIKFLDILLIRYPANYYIYMKSTHNGVHLHWKSFKPRTWKLCMLRTILISSDKELSQNELKEIEKELIKINDYPKRTFHQMNKECRLSRNEAYDKNVTANNASISTSAQLTD